MGSRFTKQEAYESARSLVVLMELLLEIDKRNKITEDNNKERGD
ncbi:MAG: hypothetical protein O2970_12225 [Proteobacteria bacterium]|nr:hypothetical protein [Pseudomonadota bacterium]